MLLTNIVLLVGRGAGKLPTQKLIKTKLCHKATQVGLFSSNATVPKNSLKGMITADHQKENGVIYDKKPFKIRLEADKKYVWCLCGQSHTQPFCDGTHRNQQLRITQKPIHFKVDETKDYWLCNCKQTNNRPFCDGVHKLPFVQEGVSIVKS